MTNIYLYRRIVQAKLFIDGNYSRAINLELTAGEACFSPFHFIRLFKKIYGKTPHQYLIAVRIARARLLLQGNQPVQQVCFAVGFDSLGSFTSLFKRSTGYTPAEFRNAAIARETEVRSRPLKFIPNCFALKNGWTENSNIEETLYVTCP